MKNKIIILMILAIIVTGCTNVKNLGTKLNEEEQKTNQTKIQYLQKEYPNSIVSFTGRTQGHKSCECLEPGLDGACVKEECKIIEGKFVWKYKICSPKFTKLCIKPEYDDVEQIWTVYKSEEYKYINKVFEILDNYKITYSAYNSSLTGMDSCVVMIKKEKDATDLINAIKEINEYFQSISTENLQMESDIVAFDEDDYSYIYEKAKSVSDINGDYSLYKILSGEDNFGKLIEKRKIDDNMFNCNSSTFTSIAYEISSHTKNYNLEIWCEGIKQKT